MSAAQTVTKQGFQIVEKGLEFYNKVLEKILPWKSIKEVAEGLERYPDNYSYEAAVTIGEIKTEALNAMDKYFCATQYIYEWCNLTSRLLETYKSLYDEHNETYFPAQKQILLKVLDNGMENMTAAHGKLEEISESFNRLTVKLTALLAQLQVDFDENSAYVKSVNAKIRRVAYETGAGGLVLGPFGLLLSISASAVVVEGQIIPEMQRKFIEIQAFYQTFKAQIEKANADIKNAKGKLDADIDNIGLNTQNEVMPAAPLGMDCLHDDIIDIVNNLIVQCDEYNKRNGNQN